MVSNTPKANSIVATVECSYGIVLLETEGKGSRPLVLYVGVVSSEGRRGSNHDDD